MNLLSQSQDMSKEYCATVVRLDQVIPAEGSDYLGVTVVQGREIVVRKDTVHENDIMIYVSNECQLNFDFLSKNNEFQDIEFNANYDEVAKELARIDKQIAEVPYTEDDDRTVAMVDALKDARKEYLQAHSGYFSKNCRVRMKKLRGTMSMGYLIKPEMMEVFAPALKEFDWASHVGEDFDTVGDELFVKAYVPEQKEQPVRGVRRNKRLKKFSRMVPGQFSFHYDTQQLQTNLNRLRPNTEVDISIKLHGTSAIMGNMLVKKPKWGGLYSRFFNWLPACWQKTVTVYDVVCSSRNVIINEDLYDGKVNVNASGAEQKEIYAWTERLRNYIPQGTTFYGEIVGYFTKSSTGVQTLGGKAYDYGSKVGENQLMIYRITSKNEEGETVEWSISQIYVYVHDLKKTLEANGEKDTARRLRPMDIIFQGPIKDLYPDLTESDEFRELLKDRQPVEGEKDEQREARELHNRIMYEEILRMNDWCSVEGKTINDFISEVVSRDSLIYKAWQAVLLQRLKNDQEHFLMEQNEPLCNNKLPREGIVVRLRDDAIAEAFKLKCVRFLNKEAEDVDKGKVDSESKARYA